MRFAESFPWRFLITNLAGESLTLLDGIAHDRRVTKALNEALVVECRVPSHDARANTTVSGQPFLQEGVRLLYCFRRESDSSPRWVIRASTIILDVTDRGDPDRAMTDVKAFDPWQLLYRRPLVNSTGDLPEQEGMSFAATAGSSIVHDILEWSIAENGTCRIDIDGGTIETTSDLDIIFQQGISVGEALDQLVQTGTLDIVLEPIYDPVSSPGVLCTLNVYERAGAQRHAAIFAWDKPPKSAVRLDRQRDGLERANKLQYYVGQGGPPVPLATETASVSKYGEYWEQQFFPGQDAADTVEAYAISQAGLREDGLVTFTMSPAPERSPVPFRDYDIGDTVPVYASSRLREESAVLRRVHRIPLLIGDDQLEAVSELLLAEEELSAS